MASAEVVERYFTAVRERDADAMARLFADDAEVVTPAGRVQGREAIADFYRYGAFAGKAALDPRPKPFVVDGERVAVEIEVTADGVLSRVADFFTVRDDEIRRLVVYMAPGIE